MPYSLSRRSFLAAAFVAVAAGSAYVGAGSAYASPAVFERGGVAASGYDVVAYFTEGSAVEGSDTYTAPYEGATWRFSSAENRDQFAANPAQYAPKYGGYCAYAAASGSKVPTDPNAWSIVDNKLYLNYSKSIQRRWEANEAAYIAEADQKWPSISN